MFAVLRFVLFILLKMCSRVSILWLNAVLEISWGNVYHGVMVGTSLGFRIREGF